MTKSSTFKEKGGIAFKATFILSSHGSGMVWMHAIAMIILQYICNDLQSQYLRYKFKFDSLLISIHVRPAWLKGHDKMLKLQQLFQNTGMALHG